MAEAFAIISLASNIAQFIECGIKIVSASKEVYESTHGIAKETRELNLIIEDIRNQSQEVVENTSSIQLSKDELAIRNYAEECNSLAEELSSVLKKLTIREDAPLRVVESGRVAMRTILKRKEVQGLKTRLQDLDGRLRDRLSKVLQEDRHSNVISEIRAIVLMHGQERIASKLQLDKLRDEILNIAKATETEHLELAERAIQLTSLATKLTALANERNRGEKQLKVIKSLYFVELKRRQSAIENAHTCTLGWLFDESSTSFVHWLESQSGIYWVNGLAGSGKSTLMKYACENERTIQALGRWAYPASLFTAGHFFWNQGFAMQKSQVGLLQTLLYQILKSVPDLVTTVCLDHYSTETWDIDELKRAFERLYQQTVLPAKFCFFIDGLDEYNGEEQDILEVIAFLAKSPNVKICVSSRPWPAFEDAFRDHKHTLVVQDFTLEDIKKYVGNGLEKNPNFQKLEAKDPRCRSIIAKIAERAQGVWLWVYLVTNDLRRALNGKEEYEMLEKILNSFPETLEKYFENIIKRRDRHYRGEMSQIFLVAVNAVQPLPVLAFTFLRLQEKDHNYAVKEEIRPITPVSNVCDGWQTWIHNRCGDLLVVRTDDRGFGHRVDFLHRTVRDFLRDNYYGKLCEGVGVDFDAKQSLCRIMLALLKRLPDGYNFRSSINQIIGLVDELLYHAYEVERSRGDAQVQLLDDLDRVVSEYAKKERNHWTHARDLPKGGPLDNYVEGGNCTFLALTVQARLVGYVRAKLDGDLRLMRKAGRPLLDYALRPRRITPIGLTHHAQREDVGVNIEMIQLLLERGADPNQPVYINDGQTVWGLFLRSCLGNKSAPEALKRTWYRAVELLADRNADSGWYCYTPGVGNTSIDYMSAIFGPEEAGSLKRRMKEVGDAQLRKKKKEAEEGITWSQWAKDLVRYWQILPPEE